MNLIFSNKLVQEQASEASLANVVILHYDPKENHSIHSPKCLTVLTIFLTEERIQ